MNNRINLEIPKTCPICGGPTTIEQTNTAKVLYCPNEDCMAKHVGNLAHFAERDAMNIDGLSEATIDKFVQEGLIKTYKDLYHLSDHKDTIVNMEGFGVKSYEKLIKAIEESRNVELSSFLYSLSVEQLGRTTSKLICNAFDNDLEKILNTTEQDLTEIDGIGSITANEIIKYFEKNTESIRELAKELKFKEAKKVDKSSSIAGKTFVVTGEVNQFANRKELQAKIESLGGKVSGSVSSKTDYLINNDSTSGSSKNKKAKSLGIPIITEAQFLDLV